MSNFWLYLPLYIRTMYLLNQNLKYRVGIVTPHIQQILSKFALLSLRNRSAVFEATLTIATFCTVMPSTLIIDRVCVVPSLLCHKTAQILYLKGRYWFEETTAFGDCMLWTVLLNVLFLSILGPNSASIPSVWLNWIDFTSTLAFDLELILVSRVTCIKDAWLFRKVFSHAFSFFSFFDKAVAIVNGFNSIIAGRRGHYHCQTYMLISYIVITRGVSEVLGIAIQLYSTELMTDTFGYRQVLTGFPRHVSQWWPV